MRQRTAGSVGGRLMPRVARRRQWTDPACYHLTDRGHNRETVFHDDADRAFFRGLVARYQQRFSFPLYHYCLMSNHFSCLVGAVGGSPTPFAPDGRTAAGLRPLFQPPLWFRGPPVARAASKAPRSSGTRYLLSCGRCIERNPLEAGLVAEPWQYALGPVVGGMRWGRAILGCRPIRWLRSWRHRQCSGSSYGGTF